MNVETQLKELEFVERNLHTNNTYEKEFFTFNKDNALKALCYLIDNAKQSIEIYHKPLTDKEENLQQNVVLKSLQKNKNIKIKYYTNFKTNDEPSLIKKHINPNTEIINLNLGEKVTYHHKEMIIDNKYTIITSMNFLTNSVTGNTDKQCVWLENFSIWIKKRSEQK